MRQLNITNPTIEDLYPLLEAGGHIINRNEFTFTRVNRFIKYDGYDNKYSQHKYVVGFYDEDNEYYYISHIFVHLNKDGVIEADYGAMPIQQFNTLSEIAKYFESK